MTTLIGFTITSANKKNYKEKETLKERGTKRYLERLIEEKEAEQLIKDYQDDSEDFPEREKD